MSKRGGAWAVGVGVLSALTMPVAIGATRYSASYDLVHSGFAIPIGIALGILAMILARRARSLGQARSGETGGSRAATLGRLLGILGVCLATAAAISLAVYGLLLTLD